MSRLLRSAVLVTTSIAAGVLVAPGAAHAADATTQLSAAGMTAALTKVSTTSTTAAKKGWKAHIDIAGEQPLTGTYVVDPKGGVASAQLRVGKQDIASYAVDGKGMYLYVNDPTSRSAVAMIGRPSVRYAFMAKALKLDDHVTKSTPSPATVLAEGVDHPGTRTSHGDGTTDYAFKADKGVTVALHVDRSGRLTSARSGSTEIKVALAYSYGAQHVKLPAASVTVAWKTLERAVAYLSMPAAVKGVADMGAAHTRKAADGKKVKVAALRTIVRSDAATFNKAAKVRVKASDVSGGARVSATNPWTHKTVSYTVTASGRTVLVKKG